MRALSFIQEAAPDQIRPKVHWRNTVSKPFRDLVARLYPGLDLNPAYWRFLGYLLFGAFFDKDSGRLVLGQQIVSYCEGTKVNHCNARAFLEAFQRDVMSPETFAWTGYRESKCRQLWRCIWLPEMEAALNEERLKLHHMEGRVYLHDGSTFSRAKQRALRKERFAEAAERCLSAHPDVRELLGYLNGLPSHLFAKQLIHLQDATTVADSISDPMVRETQFRILAGVRDQPQPSYAPSRKGRTDRIFGQDNNLTGLRGDVRRALCVGWSEADLTQCQLSILAKEWNIAPLDAFLRSGGVMWDHLIEMLGKPLVARPDLKNALKEPLYALAYGMWLARVQELFTENLKMIGIQNGGARVFQSPLIQALCRARKLAAKRVRANRGGATCFNVFLSLGKDFDEYEILAIQAQAIEMSLLLPIVHLAKQTPDFAVTLWQHDGFTVNFTRRREQWIEKINQVVKEKADSLGIYTHLEWNHLEKDKDMKASQAPHLSSPPPLGAIPPYSIINQQFYRENSRELISKSFPLAYAA